LEVDIGDFRRAGWMEKWDLFLPYYKYDLTGGEHEK